MVCVGRDLKDVLAPIPLPWSGTPSTRPGCSKPRPNWPWTIPGRGQPQLLYTICSSASPTHIVKNFFPTSSLILHSFSLKPLLLILSLHALEESASPAVLWVPFRYWKTVRRCPQSLLFSRLNNSNSLSLSSQESCSIHLTVFVALLWYHSNKSMSFLCWGLQSPVLLVWSYFFNVPMSIQGHGVSAVCSYL